jgi:hypothetical protein
MPRFWNAGAAAQASTRDARAAPLAQGHDVVTLELAGRGSRQSTHSSKVLIWNNAGLDEGA